MADSTDRTVRLRDGRRLGYAEWGSPGGRPPLYFHGWPGSRVEGRLGDEAARATGVRMIALDRPGMGLSDYQPRRRLVEARTPLPAPGSSRIGLRVRGS